MTAQRPTERAPNATKPRASKCRGPVGRDGTGHGRRRCLAGVPQGRSGQGVGVCEAGTALRADDAVARIAAGRPAERPVRHPGRGGYVPVKRPGGAVPAAGPRHRGGP